MSFSASLTVILWLVVLVLVCAMAGMLRQIRELQLVIRADAAASTGPAILDTAQEFRDSERPTAVLFVESTCATCDLLQVRLPGLTRATSGRLHLVVVFSDIPPQQKQQRLEAVDVSVMVDRSDLHAKYSVVATPHALLVDRAGRIVMSEPVGSMEAFDEFVSAGPLEGVLDELASST